ncbi:hypothetical protein ACO0QE_002840 [Hanseniaspora vineae]
MKSFLWGNKHNHHHQHQQQQQQNRKDDETVNSPRISISQPSNYQHLTTENLINAGETNNNNNNNNNNNTLTSELTNHNESQSNNNTEIDRSNQNSNRVSSTASYSSVRRSGLTRSNRSSTISTYLDESYDYTNETLASQTPATGQQQQQQQEQLRQQNFNTMSEPQLGSRSPQVLSQEGQQLTITPKKSNIPVSTLNGPMEDMRVTPRTNTLQTLKNRQSSTPKRNVSKALRNYSSTDNIRKSMNLSNLRNSFSSSTVSLGTHSNMERVEENDNEATYNSVNKQDSNALRNPFVDNGQGAKRKVRSASNATAPTQQAPAKTTSQLTLSKDNYDSYVFKMGWLNKTQSGLPNYRESKLFYSTNIDHNNESSSSTSVGSSNSSDAISSSSLSSDSYLPDYRLYKVSLQGSVLNFYKSWNNSVKYFDSTIKYEAANDTKVRLSSNTQHQSSQTPTKREVDSSTPIPSSDQTSNQSSISEDEKANDTQEHPEAQDIEQQMKFETFWPTLVYQEADGLHPDLSFDSASPSQLIFHNSLEGFVHYILFTTSLTSADIENYVLMLPIITSFEQPIKNATRPAEKSSGMLTALKYLFSFLKHFNSTVNNNITYEKEQLMIERAKFVLETIRACLLGYLMDNNCFKVMTSIIDLLGKFHSDQDFSKLKQDILNDKADLDSLLSNLKQSILPDQRLDLLEPESFIALNVSDIANAVHFINASFNSVWSPEKDYTLLYEIPSNANSLNPLMFKNQENVHFLSKLMVQHLNTTLLSTVSDAEVNILAKKRASILSKWVQLGCTFEKIGDMVSWLAIATIICSVPILRLSITWKYVPDSILKTIFKDWTPTMSQLERKNFGFSSSNIFILAPPEMNKDNIESIVPYFGDLLISKEELGIFFAEFQSRKSAKTESVSSSTVSSSTGSSSNSEKTVAKQNYKHLLKKINRTKSAFAKWKLKSDSLKDNTSVTTAKPLLDFQRKFEVFFKTQPSSREIFQQLTTFWASSSKPDQPTVSLTNVMSLSLKLEPPLVSDKLYSKISSRRSPLLSGSYLPIIFNDLLPNYSLFSKAALIGASGAKNANNNNTTSNQGIPKSISTRSVILTGNTDIDDSVADLTQQTPNLVSNKQRFLKSIRDAFNIEMNDFHINDEIILKNVYEDSAKSSSRPASMVIETPKRSSSVSMSGTLPTSPFRQSTSSSHFSALDNMNMFLKNVGNETDKISSENFVHVVLKSCTLEKIFDILVLTTSVFSKLVNSSDVKNYFQSLQTKIQENRSALQKMPSLKSNSSGNKILLNRSSVFADGNDTPQTSSTKRYSNSAQIQAAAPTFGPLDMPLINFVLDNDLFTETFFNTYKSFTTSSNVLTNLAKRFVSAQSCAVSIDNLEKNLANDSTDAFLFDKEPCFPKWDIKKQEFPEFDADMWVRVANIQIRVIEAMYFFVKEHYSDFTVSLENHATVVDFFKIVDDELKHDWKYRVRKFLHKEDSPESLDEKESLEELLPPTDLAGPAQVSKQTAVSSSQDLSLLVEKLTNLFNKTKAYYKKHYFRPLNYNKQQKNILNNLVSFDSVSPFEYHNKFSAIGDPMYSGFVNMKYDQYESIIDWVYKIDDVVVEKLKMVSVNEWLEAGQFLDLFSYSSLTSLFNNDLHSYNWDLISKTPMSQVAHDNLEISNIFTWLTSLTYPELQKNKNDFSSENFKAHPKHVMVQLPYSIQMIFKFHLSLTSFFMLHISNPYLTQEERLDVFCKILQLLLFVRWKNSQVDLFDEENAEEQPDISPHVPSFLEACILEAILAPESRFFEMTWELAYQKLSGTADPLISMSTMITNVDRERIVRFVEHDGINKRKNLTPCPGWFINRLLEISQFVPNMSIENSKLINFDKRRFLNNMVSNYFDMIPELENYGDRQENDKNFAITLFHDVSKSMILNYRTQCKKKADEESTNANYQNHGLFDEIINLELNSVMRNQHKYEELKAQEEQISSTVYVKDIKNLKNERTNSACMSMSSPSMGNFQEKGFGPTSTYQPNKSRMSNSQSIISLNSTMSSQTPSLGAASSTKLPGKRSSVMASSKNSRSSSHGEPHQNRTSRIGGFFRRPFSLSGFSSSSSNSSLNSYVANNKGAISPQALPVVTFQETRDAKPQISVKTFEIKSCMPLHSYKHNPHCCDAFKICMNNGVEYCVQATSSEDMHEWITVINKSKRYSFYSVRYRGKTHNKIFGVPLEDLCEREGVLVPAVVTRLLEEIELRGLDEVGLYRVPGSVGSINSLKQAFDTYGAENNNNFTLEDDRWFEINAIAGCFKLFLRDLPESLLTESRLDDFISVMAQYKIDDNKELMENNIRNLLKQIPMCNYHVMKRLFQHLNRVHSHFENNKMDATNLAIVFSMSFISKDDLSMTVGSKLGALQSILQHFIRSPETFFT